MPKRNAIPLPSGLSALHASVLGTAWLTAYRALFTKSGLRSGQTLLVQGSSGGMATALIQLGRAAGFEVWTTSRNDEGRALAEKLGAHRTFTSNEKLPRKAQAVVDNVGPATWTLSAPLLASQSSRWMRRVIMRLSTSDGGCTCGMPNLFRVSSFELRFFPPAGGR